MKTLKLVLSVLVLTLTMSFSPMKEKARSVKTQHIVLVLKSPMDQETFSVFDIEQVGDILVGTNKNAEDYLVKGGLYRIEGASNDKFYHKKIVILD